MYSHLTNAELARLLESYTAPTDVIPLALLQEAAERLRIDPNYRPER